MAIVDQILSIEVTGEEFYFLKLEALWILTNLSTVIDSEDLRLVFLSSYQDDVNFDDSDVVKDDFT